MKIISIEGNIGSGKSTIINVLKQNQQENTSLIFLLEPVDQWEKIVDSDGTNILTKYYSDQERYAFSFQMMAFITRLRQINEIIEKYSKEDVTIITERCIFTDREIFAKMLFNDSKIEKIEYSIYINWFDYFVKNINIDKYIYINTPPDICLKRIAKRNRSGESIPLEYLQNLEFFHQEWLSSKENMIEVNGTSEINTNIIDNLIKLFV
jgi:deoxyadenosine/deoxycytidine kinase